MAVFGLGDTLRLANRVAAGDEGGRAHGTVPPAPKPGGLYRHQHERQYRRGFNTRTALAAPGLEI